MLELQSLSSASCFYYLLSEFHSVLGVVLWQHAYFSTWKHAHRLVMLGLSIDPKVSGLTNSWEDPPFLYLRVLKSYHYHYHCHGLNVLFSNHFVNSIVILEYSIYVYSWEWTPQKSTFPGFAGTRFEPSRAKTPRISCRLQALPVSFVCTTHAEARRESVVGAAVAILTGENTSMATGPRGNREKSQSNLIHFAKCLVSSMWAF